MAGQGAMDFFAAQDRARRNTGRLVVLLLVAVVSLVVMASLAVALVVVVTDGGQAQQGGADPLARALDPYLLGTVALAVLALVVLGSLFKHLQLRAGGRAVAEALGGRLINGNPQDADEQRILNIVEEMAIASGTPVPAVYLLDDPAINAFAAGHSPQDAVVGITRGAIRLLDRDELQGVVAHEFSHILNGDMRLNLRLVALLHGLLLIGLIGHLVLRGAGGRRMVRGNRNNNGQAVMLGLGAALMVVGYVGTLCGNLIKAAVSRQREYLADASAVQFTRQAHGIGGALKKIAVHQQGSQLAAANAAEFSHLYFSRGIRAAKGALATHPPLEQRIRRVEPGWDGQLPRLAIPSADPDERETRPPADQPTAQPSRDAKQLVTMALATIGQLDQAHIDDARRRLSELDPRLLEAAHDLCAARALAYGVLIHLGAEHDSDSKHLRQLLDGLADSAVLRELDALAAPLAALPADQRLVLLELAIPMLKQLSTNQYALFKRCLERLVDSAGAPDALQWALYRVLVQGVEGRSERRRSRTLEALAEPAALLLSSMAHAGASDAAEARRAFVAGVARLAPLSLDYVAQPATFRNLDMSLDRLQRLDGSGRARLLTALAGCVEHDGDVSIREIELFRALSEALDCPLPPLLDDEQ